jgi:hypothetical protein
MQTAFDASAVLGESRRLCADRIAACVRMPPYVHGPLRPLPREMLAFSGGQLLPAFPTLPAREVLKTIQTTLRTRWVCRSHYKGRPTDLATCTAELDNYGNVLLSFADGAVPVYVVRSVAAYHPALTAVVRANGFANGWMRRGSAVGLVPCSVCGKKSEGSWAGFPGCDMDCLAPSISGCDMRKLARLALALARHTDDVMQDTEAQLRTNLCTCVQRNREAATPAPAYEGFGGETAA